MSVTSTQVYEGGQFPLIQTNSLDLYNFRCKIKEIDFEDYVIKTNDIVSVSFSCSYIDSYEKEQTIKIPFVTKKFDNSSVLFANRYDNTGLPLWKDTDFLTTIEEQYFFENENTDLYDLPEKGNYWKINTRKPTISIGDLVTVYFADFKSDIYLKDTPYNGDFKDGALFFQKYHQNYYPEEKLNLFLNSGDPKYLDLEENNLLIPTFTDFTLDSDPI